MHDSTGSPRKHLLESTFTSARLGGIEKGSIVIDSKPEHLFAGSLGGIMATEDSIMVEKEEQTFVIRDPQEQKFRTIVDAKIKEFRTLRQLEQQLRKQTPRITMRPYKPSPFDTHSTIKRIAGQVKQLDHQRCKSSE